MYIGHSYLTEENICAQITMKEYGNMEKLTLLFSGQLLLMKMLLFPQINSLFWTFPLQLVVEAPMKNGYNFLLFCVGRGKGI